MTIQTIKTAAGETLVILPLDEYEALEDAVDAARHVTVMAKLARGESEALTSKEVRTLLAAPTPLAFWRRKRGFTQSALAKRAEISQSYLASLEAGKRKGDPALVKRLARALTLRMEDLVAD
ncbi:MAG: helix-turn-helix transcriptional regulator [Hyphomicrobiales bacterium]|nr:helix-turn-helix transcriptional regulator [Hyphomicrobiales bacterium]